jgi:hypothetical protein
MEKQVEAYHREMHPQGRSSRDPMGEYPRYLGERDDRSKGKLTRICRHAE